MLSSSRDPENFCSSSAILR